MIIRSQIVLIQITKAEDIMSKAGVIFYCITCINSERGGCCQGCLNLGPNGCTNKPLACALWLCGDAQQDFPQVSNELREIQLQFPAPISYGYRHRSLEAEVYIQI